MKYISLVFILICFTSCYSERSKSVSRETIELSFGISSMSIKTVETMSIKTVEINGETFYASRSSHGCWILGPRVKSEKD